MAAELATQNKKPNRIMEIGQIGTTFFKASHVSFVAVLACAPPL